MAQRKLWAPRLLDELDTDILGLRKDKRRQNVAPVGARLQEGI